MNIFSKLFLALALMASPAHAVLNFNNLPAEVPTDLQDKLAWGLFKLDKQVIEEALDAGANPSPIYVIENEAHYAYEVAIGHLFMLHNEIEKSDTYKNINDVAHIAQKFRKIFEMWELLITRGISVDIHVNMYYLHTGSVREFIVRRAHFDEDGPIENDLWKREYFEHMRMMCKHLQLLVDKYQPEVK